MSEINPDIIVNHRYILRDMIGSGGMGAVFRATDRLTGGDIALKKVNTSPEEIAFSSKSGDSDLNFALAQEFKTLASLRHPNVINVIDYGFDEKKQPYFTMEFLENTQSIVNAGKDQPLDFQIDLIVQMLQALIYLHRRGVIHRDLKPANVIVQDGKVKVLDFGLSVIVDQSVSNATQTTAGTFAYMAPEVLSGQPSTRRSDIYSVGMIAYEMIAGEYPFNKKNIGTLVASILNNPVDVKGAGLNGDLAELLESLLIKDHEQRPNNARELVLSFCKSVNIDPPEETIEIRDSYLQSAKFVGREKEVYKIENAIGKIFDGKGTALVVGGESGVGKTRLSDELRTLAMIKGAHVLNGQAVRAGGNAYQLWYEILSWLVLAVPLEGNQASVLKAIIPEIETLLEKEVPDPPKVDPRAAQVRLIRVAVEVISKLDHPLVLVLEDLQWAEINSLTLLDRLVNEISDNAIFVFGNYRDDEFLDLSEVLPGVEIHKLDRLEDASIEKLSESMLGDLGTQKSLVDLLKRETEGNPFFIVEVIRVLAEQAGRLDQIDLIALPEKMIVKGVQDILFHRLDRVPDYIQEFLQVAAVAGRQQDLALLQALFPDVDLFNYLSALTDLAILEPKGKTWHFSHDKLHEVVLDNLPEDLSIQLHHQIAEKIEEVYQNYLPEYYEALANHYVKGKIWEKALEYLVKAGDRMADSFANQVALDYYARALEACELLGDAKQSAQMIILKKRGQIYISLGQLINSAEDYNRLVEIARLLDDKYQEALGLVYLGYSYHFWHKPKEAEENLKLALDIAKDTYPDIVFYANSIYALFLKVFNRHDESQTVLDTIKTLPEEVTNPFFINMWRTTSVLTPRWKGQPKEVLKFFERYGQAIAKESSAAIASHWFEGLAYCDAGQYTKALETFQDTLNDSIQMGEFTWRIRVLNSFGWFYNEIQDYDKAMEWNIRAIETTLTANLPDPEVECNAKINRGDTMMLMGKLDEAEKIFEEVEILSNDDSVKFMVWRYTQHLYHSYGELKFLQGDLDTALDYAHICLSLAERSDSRKNIAKGARLKAQVLTARGEYQEAQKELDRALENAQLVGNPPQAWKTYAAMGELYKAQDKTDQAKTAYQEAIAVIDSVAGELDEAHRKIFLDSIHIQGIKQAAE